MNKIARWIATRNKDKVIRNSFLLPILLVVAISISHVTTWYDLGNPIAWAIYLSIAIEIFALASVSAASIKMNRFSIWFLFSLVTSVQIIGNVFFTYNDINVEGSFFKSWVELIQPAFSEWTITDHKRLLALIQGGLLPIMSLTALHYYIKFGDKDIKKQEDDLKKEPEPQYKTRGFWPESEQKSEEKKSEETLASMMADYKEEIVIPDETPAMPEPQPSPENLTNETTPQSTTTITNDGRVQETFNFEKFFNDKNPPPETMTSKINT